MFETLSKQVTQQIVSPVFFAILLWFFLSISFGVTGGEATTSIFLFGFFIAEFFINLVSNLSVTSAQFGYFVIFIGSCINFLIYFYIGLQIQKEISRRKGVSR